MTTLNEATIIAACKEGDVQILTELLEKDPEACHRSIAWTDKEQKDLDTPPIFIAVDYGHLEAVKVLAEKGDINIADSNDYTPLQWASWNGNEELVKFLVSKGARADQDALDLAKEYEHNHIVELLTQHVDLYSDLGGDLDEIMIKASREGDLEKVQELIADGYDFNKWKGEDESYQEYSPIYVAMKNGHVKLIGEFMAAGVEAELHSTHFIYDADKPKPAELSEEQIAEITKAMQEEAAEEEAAAAAFVAAATETIEEEPESS